MSKMKHWLNTSALAALAALSACSTYEADPASIGVIVGDSLYVALSIDVRGTQAVTRANPNGGEEGDGWEYGRTYENQLHNFTVFVLGNEADANAPARTCFAGSRYFSDAEVAAADSLHEVELKLKSYDVLKDVTTYDFTIPIIRGRQDRMPAPETYCFIVVANNGDLTSTYSTLGDLRDAQPAATWTPTSDGPTRFVMANEDDQYYAHGEGSEQNPIRLHVTIERMAARIDFDPKGGELVEGALRYSVPGSDAANPLAYLYLDRAAIVNGCERPSYYIKRVADDFSGTNLTYLGDETPTPRGEATNFIIDPYSTQKNEDNRTNTTLLTQLFGSSRIANSAALLSAAGSQLPTITSLSSAVTLGYVNENTFAPEMALSEYATGVVLQCRYLPNHDVYSAYDAESGALTEGTLALGQTFYMVEPNQQEVSEADRLYFTTRTAADAYATDTEHNHFGKVTEYTGGVCYYYVYMRHSNKVEVVHNTMEFGIVRNNIYRFSLQPATGPGTPTADPRHPEELKARVYVRKWLSVEHPVIYV